MIGFLRNLFSGFRPSLPVSAALDAPQAELLDAPAVMPSHPALRPTLTVRLSTGEVWETDIPTSAQP